MLYFLLFNIAPTIVELAAVLIIFWTKFSFGLASATALMVVVYIIFTRKVTDWRNALRTRMNDLDTLTIGRSVDSLLNYETVKYFGAEEREEARYPRRRRPICQAPRSRARTALPGSISGRASSPTPRSRARWRTPCGAGRPANTRSAMCVLVNTLLAQLFRPLDMLGMVYRVIRQGLIDMEAMFRLIDTPPEISDVPEGAWPLVVNGGAVAFENVVFGYEPDRTILNGVSFAVGAGETLAIVGPSGAGKSTIARLLFRFYDPQGGRDARSTGRISRRSRRKACAPRSASSRRIRCCSTTASATTSPMAARARVRRRNRGGRRGRGDRRLHCACCRKAMTPRSANAG